MIGAFTFGSIQLAQAQDAPAAEQTEQQAAPAAEATTAAAPAAEEGGIHKEIKVKFIEGTASFMSLVAIALVIGLALCIERIIYLSLAIIALSILPLFFMRLAVGRLHPNSLAIPSIPYTYFFSVSVTGCGNASA